MRSIYLTLLLVVACFHAISTQTQAPSQTARQALIEMLLAKTPEAFERHLPDAMRSMLLRDDDTSRMPVLQQLTSIRSGIATGGGEVETFDAGPVLLTVDEKQAQRRVEVIVERDDLEGDAEEVVLSVHPYLEGKVEPMPVVPRLILSMKQEKEIWKLNEITVALHVPLSDPDYLKGLQKTQNSSFESSAIGSVRTINTAEVTYQAAYPDRGYSCRLSKLGGSGTEQAPGPEHALLVDEELASGKRSGYTFSISGCDQAPASKYRVAAVPVDQESEMRAFCSDESGVVRYSTDGKAATCLRDGVPLQ